MLEIEIFYEIIMYTLHTHKVVQILYVSINHIDIYINIVYTTYTMRESASSRRSLLAVAQPGLKYKFVCFLCTHTIFFIISTGGRVGEFVFLIVCGNVHVIQQQQKQQQPVVYHAMLLLLLSLLILLRIEGEPRLMINRQPIINV